jgi:hypothetical protein
MMTSLGPTVYAIATMMHEVLHKARGGIDDGPLAAALNVVLPKTGSTTEITDALLAKCF